MEHLTLDIENGVATVTLNRPDKKNAMSLTLFEELAATGENLKTQAGLRAVILTGAGTDFCAGIDLTALQSFLPRMGEIRDQMRNPPAGEVANWFQKPCYVWQELDVPVIAAIQGVCIGAGLQLALAADIRIAAPNTRVSIMEAKWGLIPDMGITQNLPKLMRADQAKELMMTARMINASDALDMGLVTRISEDPLAAAKDLVVELVSRSPQAVNGAKALVDQTWTLPLGEGLKVEAELQAQIIGTDNQLEAVMAGMTKRPPKFK